VKRRRSLTHIGGAVETTGQKDVAAVLAEALDVAPSQEPRGDQRGDSPRSERDDPDRFHVHGFHSYPARMHPATASRLVRGLSAEGATVLDPFCGSGTVLVEGMIAGRRMIGTDLNPLAVRLAGLKTSPRTATERDLLVAMASPRSPTSGGCAGRGPRSGTRRRTWRPSPRTCCSSSTRCAPASSTWATPR
jgi:hypothetical protein